MKTTACIFTRTVQNETAGSILTPCLRFIQLALLVQLISLGSSSPAGDNKRNKPKKCMEFRLDTTWDGRDVNYDDVIINLSPSANGVKIDVSAPFFNSPKAPPGKPGEPFFKLWDYEVVEAFFLGERDRYLEVELGPHGQHLLLLLDGVGNAIKHSLPLNYTATINDDFWSGHAEIPASYFPPDVYLFNAYAIHGEGDDRIYQALYPAPEGKYPAPNFHRLELFKPLDFKKLLPSNPKSNLSDVWKNAMP